MILASPSASQTCGLASDFKAYFSVEMSININKKVDSLQNYFLWLFYDFFRKTLVHRCLTGFWIRLWSLQLSFSDNFWRRNRCFINLFWSMLNRANPERTMTVWLAFLSSIKLWIWSLSFVINETLTETLILRKWKLTAYTESSE